jgi:hypothetical protein
MRRPANTSAVLDYSRGATGPGPGAEAADQLLGSAVRPSRQLLALAADEVQRRGMFRLQEQQQTAYRVVLRALERARRGVTKQAILVVGGPGWGKSVIALSLLGQLSRQGRTVLHATGSSAFTQTLRKVAGQRAPRLKAMFRYFNQFGELEPNELDVLLCDEAHRIRETSANRYTKASARTGTPQVDELQQVARVPVFLLDEHQVVRPGGLGSLREIQAAAARLGIDVECVELDGQYRCGGSRAYETWVLRLLGLEPGGPMVWEGDEHFAVQLAESAEHMEAALRRHQDAGYSARISAGYCWPWGDARADGSLPEDVVVGEGRRPWNNKKDASVGGAPGRPFWSSDPAGFGQGRLRLHRARLRVRLVGRDSGARPGVARRPLGRAAGRELRHASQAGAAAGVRPGGAQHLQGAADARHAGVGGVQHGSRDAAVLEWGAAG